MDHVSGQSQELQGYILERNRLKFRQLELEARRSGFSASRVRPTTTPDSEPVSDGAALSASAARSTDGTKVEAPCSVRCRVYGKGVDSFVAGEEAEFIIQVAAPWMTDASRAMHTLS